MKKNILIIGGSGGIGLEIVKLLSAENNVIVASRTKGGLGELKVTHYEFDVLKNDIQDIDLPEAIDGLVYCPGSINLKPLKMLKVEAFEKDMNLNFFSLVKVVQGLMPNLKKAHLPSLVFFSTVAVQKGMPFHTSVAASKGAIEGFARALAAEYAPTIRVNVIAPSLIDTPLAEKLLSNEDKRSKMAARHPLKRIGSTADIATMVEFLLSSKSTWMTGQVLGIDGGLSSLNIN